MFTVPMPYLRGRTSTENATKEHIATQAFRYGVSRGRKLAAEEAAVKEEAKAFHARVKEEIDAKCLPPTFTFHEFVSQSRGMQSGELFSLSGYELMAKSAPHEAQLLDRIWCRADTVLKALMKAEDNRPEERPLTDEQIIARAKDIMRARIRRTRNKIDAFAGVQMELEKEVLSYERAEAGLDRAALSDERAARAGKTPWPYSVRSVRSFDPRA